MTQEKYDIAIIGGSVIGLSLANILAPSNLNILIVEKNNTITDTLRAVSVDSLVLDTWKHCNLLEDMKPYLYEYDEGDLTLQYLETPQSPLLSFTEKKTKTNRIANIMQYKIEEILLQNLYQYSNVTILMNTTFTSFQIKKENVTISIQQPNGNTNKIQSIYLIGCDGGKSEVRHQLGYKMKGHTLKNKWLITNILQDVTNKKESIKVNCNYKSTWATIPIPQNLIHFEYMLHTHEKSLELNDATITNLIHSQQPNIIINKIIEPRIQDFHFRISSSYTDQSLHIFLAGDSAHLIPPFTGKGISLGISDALNLADKLTLILKNKEITETQRRSILATYENAQRKHIKKVFHITKLVMKIMIPKNYIQMKIQNLCLKIINSNKFLKNIMYMR